MVTAELAVALPAVVLVLGLVLGGVAAGVDQIRCVDAARLGARALARGDAAEAVRSVASRAAPPGAAIILDNAGAVVRVRVSVVRRLPGGAGLHLEAESVAEREQPP
ncbi:MAG: hypothetical protein M3Z83_00090 [Actinomycetota bacterium]|nr:hypothetical protein [Actinomycetota bacterium]